jgi:CheY-like chemotaxis protein
MVSSPCLRPARKTHLLCSRPMKSRHLARQLLYPSTTQTQLQRLIPCLRPMCETALVIDDSLPVQMQMLAALHPIAAHIDFADRAVRAMEFLESGLYSVVFLDVMLPDADSYDVCQRIRRHPRHKNTPVVMLAGRTAPADRLKGTAAGCNAYLIKPVRQAILQQILGQFVHAPAELA